MTAIAVQSARYDELRALGATPSEAALVLSVEAEVDQVIELVSDAWRREARVHGKFAKTPGSGLSDIERMQAKRATPNRRYGVGPVQAKMAKAMQAPPTSPLSTAHVTQEEAQQIANTAVVKMHPIQMKQIMAQVEQATQRYHMEKDAKGEIEENKRRTRTLAWHAGVIGAGGVLAAIEYKLGLPGMAQLGTALAPQILQEVLDKVKGTG